jgi:hypothetical protein
MDHQRDDYAEPDLISPWDPAGRRVACCIVLFVAVLALALLAIAFSPMLLWWAPA